jgi:hypothetical protein
MYARVQRSSIVGSMGSADPIQEPGVSCRPGFPFKANPISLPEYGRARIDGLPRIEGPTRPITDIAV